MPLFCAVVTFLYHPGAFAPPLPRGELSSRDAEGGVPCIKFRNDKGECNPRFEGGLPNRRLATMASGNKKREIKKYSHFCDYTLFVERVMGIGPTYPAWKAGVLPLNYTRRSRVKKRFRQASLYRFSAAVSMFEREQTLRSSIYAAKHKAAKFQRQTVVNCGFLLRRIPVQRGLNDAAIFPVGVLQSPSCALFL